MGEPQEVQTVAFEADRQLRTPKEALQVVPIGDVCPRPNFLGAYSLVHTDDGATALRDQRIAEHEARLRNSQAQGPMAPDTEYDEPDLVSTTGC